MTLAFTIHHIFTSEVIGKNKSLIDSLFLQDEYNPFVKDANSNKIALVTDSRLSVILSNLIDSGNVLLKNVGLGASVHNGSHPGLNDFQSRQMNLIFDPASKLSDFQKKLAIYDLVRFSKDVAVSGNPPVMRTSANDWFQVFGEKSVSFELLREGD